MKKVSKKKVVAKAVEKKTRRRAPMPLVREINRRFDYVTDLTKQQVDDCIAARASAKKMGLLIARTTPPGRDQALALTKLEEALHYTIAAIVRPHTGE